MKIVGIADEVIEVPDAERSRVRGGEIGTRFFCQERESI